MTNLSATDSSGTNREDPLFPLANLIDDRAGMPFKFTTSGAAHRIDIDSVLVDTQTIDRLFIPAGHNLTGTLDVLSDDEPTFTGASVILNNYAIPASGAVDASIGTWVIERYTRIRFDATGKWEIPELYLTETLTTAIGPEQGWDDDLIEHVLHLEKASGASAHFQQGPDQRRWRLTYPGVSAAADLEILEQLYALGTHRVFLFDPPYDDEPAVLATIANRRRQNETRVPTGGTKTMRYEFEVLESLA